MNEWIMIYQYDCTRAATNDYFYFDKSNLSNLSINLND